MENTADREIIQTRLLNAPRSLVWQAWTDPKHLIHWWGPDGFTNTFHEISVKPGGIWRFMMHGPDGVDYPNRIEFLEVVEPEKITYRHVEDSEEEAICFFNTVTFEDRGDKTFLTMRAVFPTQEEKDYVVREHGAIEGGKQTIDKLEAYLATMND